MLHKNLPQTSSPCLSAKRACFFAALNDLMVDTRVHIKTTDLIIVETQDEGLFAIGYETDNAH